MHVTYKSPFNVYLRHQLNLHFTSYVLYNGDRKISVSLFNYKKNCRISIKIIFFKNSIDDILVICILNTYLSNHPESHSFSAESLMQKFYNGVSFYFIIKRSIRTKRMGKIKGLGKRLNWSLEYSFSKIWPIFVQGYKIGGTHVYLNHYIHCFKHLITKYFSDSLQFNFIWVS